MTDRDDAHAPNGDGAPRLTRVLKLRVRRLLDRLRAEPADPVVTFTAGCEPAGVRDTLVAPRYDDLAVRPEQQNGARDDV